MQFTEKVDILEYSIIQFNQRLFDILLEDKTTKSNIIWATNDYVSSGKQYAATEPIMPELLVGKYAKLIQPRAAKRSDQKNSRTREKAEVFTPSWICNAQNNLIDEQWFSRPDVFNKTQGTVWTPVTDKISFSDKKGRTWRDYVDARRIEVTCGEAPYLVSRYDTVTGEPIELFSRIGLLDRKLRVVTENAQEDDWLKWAYRAFESIYGFEFQGDNLLLARENLLYTFIENMRYALNRTPSLNELKKVANIIAWNIWQMDGLTFAPPLCDVQAEVEQLNLFDAIDTEKRAKQPRCLIRDWRSKCVVEYYSLAKGEQ